jgi:hypothetical protein
MTANLMVTLSNDQASPRREDLGLGVEVTMDPGQFGSYGAVTTYFQIDPKEWIVAITLAQHFPP